MKISVIIPTYKPQEYIWQCLDSLSKQTFQCSSFEIIIVLNGCCEPWKGELESYISANMSSLNVKLVQIDQGGVSNARNVAIDMAQGEYVTFIDDDDYVSPRYLEGLYELASEDTISLCYPFAFDDAEPEKQLDNYKMTLQYNKVHCDGKLPYQKARKFFSGPCMKLIPRRLIADRRFDINFKNGEDSLFMFLISDEFKYVRFAPQYVCYYRRMRENSAYTRKRSVMNKFLNACSLITAFSKIYFRRMRHYNFTFYMTRLLGACRSVLN